MRRKALLLTVSTGIAASVLLVPFVTGNSAFSANERAEDGKKPAIVQMAQANTTAAATAATGEHAAKSYHAARWDPIHFKPAIDKASDADCLACHKEIVERKPREMSPAGVKASDTLAWYQTLDTYSGNQESFHWRHIESPFAKKVMNLSCNFCHQGNDPREESPGPHLVGAEAGSFTLRKMVNPKTTCLRCHGQYDYEIMSTGPWQEFRADLEDEETPNGCLTCHEELFRTVRHQVTYLNADAIEEAAKTSSDVCFGCHGGRSWYRISYPYPRHAWPDMDEEEVPDWAKDRPTESEERFRKAKAE